MHNIFLYSHIVAGFLALIIGIVPMVAKKGSTLHKKTGLVFVGAMVFTATSALILALPAKNYFLASIGVFSLYMTIAGLRLARHHNLGFNLFDKMLAVGGFVTGVFMAAFGGYQYGASGNFMGVILAVFGFILLAMTLPDSIKALGRAKQQPVPNAWFFSHIARMVGAYIATFTAFAVTNFHFIPGVFNWLVPTVVGTVAISITIRRYKNKMS